MKASIRYQIVRAAADLRAAGVSVKLKQLSLCCIAVVDGDVRNANDLPKLAQQLTRWKAA